eukprot:6151510-Pyramimonas_sp.AAC.2
MFGRSGICVSGGCVSGRCVHVQGGGLTTLGLGNPGWGINPRACQSRCAARVSDEVKYGARFSRHV